MVTLGMLWLPILVATVLVFIASSVIWMALPYTSRTLGSSRMRGPPSSRWPRRIWRPERIGSPGRTT